MEKKTPLYIHAKARNNPWAIATAAVGRLDPAKYEKVVKAIKAKKK